MSTDWLYNYNLSVDLIPALIDLYSFESENATAYETEYEGCVRAKNLLGLENNWNVTVGTSSLNNGFDCLWMLMGNNVIGSPHGGANRIIIPVYPSSSPNDNMFHVMQHELGHVYGAGEISEIVCIMGAFESDNFATHLFLASNLALINEEHFDGPQ